MRTSKPCSPSTTSSIRAAMGREILEYVLGIDDRAFPLGLYGHGRRRQPDEGGDRRFDRGHHGFPHLCAGDQTEYYGYRLDSVLRMNSYKLHGILNGIDMDAFNRRPIPRSSRTTVPRRRRTKGQQTRAAQAVRPRGRRDHAGHRHGHPFCRPEGPRPDRSRAA